MEIFWASVATGVFTLAGVLGATWLSQRGEKERREEEARLKEQQLAHERKIKKDELTHEHRARLYDARLTRYSEFLAVWLMYSRQLNRLGLLWGQRHHSAQRLTDTSHSDGETKALDAITVQLSEAHQASEEAFKKLEDAITALQVVASTPVYESVLQLERESGEVFTARVDLATRPDESANLWGDFQSAQKKLKKSHAELREAIRRELRLDDEDNLGEVPEA